MSHRAIVCALACALLAGQPARAGSTDLRIGMAGNDLGNLDPHRATATPDVALLYWMFDGLVRITPGKASPEFIEPDIASSWTSSDDRLTWTFKIRDDVQCQGDYGKLAAEDVVYSLNRARSKETSSFFADYAAVDSVTAPDPSTVVIKLKTRVPSLLGLLVPYHGGNIVCRKAVEALGADYAKKPVGTGPFQFVDYQPQQYVTLKANEHYFRGAPAIKQITYRYIPSDASRDLAYRSGELDMIYGRQDDQWVNRMSGMDGTHLQKIGPGELYEFNLDTTKPPLDDLKVREAIAHGIDRAQLVKFKGPNVTQEAQSVVPANYLGFAPVKLLDYDPAKSKELLTQAGHPDGVTVKVIQTTLPGMLTTTQAVQAQLKKVGVNLDVVTVEHATFHSQIRQDLSPMTLYAAARFPVADTYLTQFFDSKSIVGTPTAITNFSHCNVADAEITAARTEPDDARQKELWKTAQQKIVDAVCAVPIYEIPQVWVWKNTLDIGYPVEGSINLAPPITEKTHFTD